MRSLRIHYLQHVAFEGLGYIETWANQNKYPLTSTRYYESWKLPELSAFDWLIIMGGPMGVYDENKFFWLSEEKAFIEKTIRANKTVIGICLGAQLIATALGARVYPNTKKEIGWFPVTKTTASENHFLFKDLPDTCPVFHWHGDTFDLPDGAVHLLQTSICPHQAFIWNKKVLGLQFHLEVTPQTLTSMIDNCRQELIRDTFVQNEKEISNCSGLCESSNLYLKNILTQLALKDLQESL